MDIFVNPICLLFTKFLRVEPKMLKTRVFLLKLRADLRVEDVKSHSFKRRCRGFSNRACWKTKAFIRFSRVWDAENIDSFLIELVSNWALERVLRSIRNECCVYRIPGICATDAWGMRQRKVIALTSSPLNIGFCSQSHNKFYARCLSAGTTWHGKRIELLKI